MDHEIKFLRKIISRYMEKKGGIGNNSSVLNQTPEMIERDRVRELLQKCVYLFNLAYEEQTKNF